MPRNIDAPADDSPHEKDVLKTNAHKYLENGPNVGKFQILFFRR